MPIKDAYLLLIFLLTLTGCFDKASPTKIVETPDSSSSSETPSSSSAIDPDKYSNLPCALSESETTIYLDSLSCPLDYDTLQGLPLTQVYGGVQSVKVIYKIETDRLYFVDTKEYPIHYDFCRDYLDYNKGHGTFNRDNYHEHEGREYLLGVLQHYTSSGLFVLELSSSDQMYSSNIVKLYNLVKDHFYADDELYYMAISNTMQAQADSLKGTIPVIDRDEIFAGQIYQPLNLEKSYGYLVKKDVEAVEQEYLGKHDIVLTNSVPNDIPVVAGIITTEFQTPLSHINVLSQNRETPNMALKGAWDNEELNDLVGKLVYLEVKLDTFIIEEAELEDAEEFWETTSPSEEQFLEIDSTSGLFDLDDLSYRTISLVGAKASNFAEISRIETSSNNFVPVPEGGFAIPFYYYLQHIEENNLQTFIDEMLNDNSFKSDVEVRQNKLLELRELITSAPINENFLNSVEEKIIENGEYTRMRFRSSTNAEDIEGFNGAGLYSSYTGMLDDEDQTVERAIKRVWASLWNFRAYEEREYFKIQHHTVAMGVLVHRSFPNEVANGVAITANIYNDGLPGLIVNVQKNEISIVNPPPGVTSDQFIFYTWADDAFTDPVISYLSESSINDGKPVMSDEEAAELARHLEAIKNHYYHIHGSGSWSDFAMDVEFKLDSPDRKLYIKQARPY